MNETTEQNYGGQVKQTNENLPPQLKGHKAVPPTPYHGHINTQYKGDVSVEPKTMEECVSEHKARLAKK